MNVRLFVNIFNRWYIVHPKHDNLAWSGLRWTECDPADGTPTGDHQISNFGTKMEATAYAEHYGFTVTEN